MRAKVFERAAPKVKMCEIDVRVLCARGISTRFLSEAKLFVGVTMTSEDTDRKQLSH